MKRQLIFVYLIALHLAVGWILFKTDVWERAAAKAGFATSPEQSFIPAIREIHKQMDASVPAGATIFLGDSITMALATAAVAPHAVNFGIASQRSDHLLESMGLYKSLQRAGAVVISIGVNDLLQNREPGIEHRYREILQAVPSSVLVVMNSVTPITQVPESRQIAARDAARQACLARPGCRFVDAFELLSAASGSLLPDGVHVAAAGYALWIPAMQKALR